MHIQHFNGHCDVDAAEYTCVADTPTGSVRSSADLEVLVPPRFVDPFFEPKQKILDEQEKLKLNCQVNGHPTPLVMGNFRVKADDFDLFLAEIIRSRLGDMHVVLRLAARYFVFFFLHTWSSEIYKWMHACLIFRCW